LQLLVWPRHRGSLWINIQISFHNSWHCGFRVILYLSVVYLAGNVIMAVTAITPPFW